MQVRMLPLSAALLATASFAQSGSYQDGTFLCCKSIPNGTDMNPVTGDTYNQNTQAFIVQVGNFQYFISKESMGNVTHSPFTREDMS